MNERVLMAQVVGFVEFHLFQRSCSNNRPQKQTTKNDTNRNDDDNNNGSMIGVFEVHVKHYNNMQQLQHRNHHKCGCIVGSWLLLSAPDIKAIWLHRGGAPAFRNLPKVLEALAAFIVESGVRLVGISQVESEGRHIFRDV